MEPSLSLQPARVTCPGPGKALEVVTLQINRHVWKETARGDTGAEATSPCRGGESCPTAGSEGQGPWGWTAPTRPSSVTRDAWP